MSRSQVHTIEDVMSLTNDGEYVFQRELGKLSSTTNVSAPWRKDSAPSLRVKRDSKTNKIKYTDYGGDQTSGDCIDFIQKLYNLNSKDAIEKIINDFSFGSFVTPTIKQPTLPPSKKSSTTYNFIEQPFTPRHHEYFNQYGLSEDFVTEEGDIYAVKSWFANDRKQTIQTDETVFCYIFRDQTGKETGKLKFLRLGVEKKDKWRTNIPNSAIWYEYKWQGKDIDKLFISKSNKDSLCLIHEGIPTVNTQSENSIILRQSIPHLLKICPNLIMSYGADEQAVTESQKITREFGLKWWNTPKNVLQYDCTDHSDYIKEFGRIRFQKLLKLKGYL